MTMNSTPITVFISYSHKDERYKEALEEHLSVLQRHGKIASWSDRKISPGSSWKSEIDRNIEKADIILLLVSSSFIASGYCYEKELAVALSRQENEDAVVIPIFVRPADLSDEPLMGLQGLPKDAVSISEWENEDLAWRDVAKGIRLVVDAIQQRNSRKNEPSEMSSLGETLTALVDDIDQIYQPGSHTSGISTGFSDIDRVIGNLRPGQLITIAARPGMGKTNFGLSIVGAVAARELPALVFSTKTSKKEVMSRLVTITGRLSHTRLHFGSMRDDDWPRLTLAVQKLSNSEMWFDDSTALSLDDLREKCFKAKSKLGAIGIVLVDSVNYLRTASDDATRGDLIARELKSLARELNCVVMVTAPVQRAVDSRPNKRPVRSDLGDWHDLGDESDILAFIYRDDYYNPESVLRGTAEVLLDRNQYGPVGAIRIAYDRECGVFSDFGGAPEQGM
ncbi:DnaB-like helicase C-terminal domain-containing protein [Burkholderia sp. BE17]|uniref:DnaB-like helicase C-terminal domain-containing protein n=1 Tax=Burkholderia sp. BE17 TaxID=2656644 RepID=UPI00128E8218|nr:DnaB-like helicase C-terminal domain-containing protein [Burkholderia sp. BE17]MPV66326.1 TIR domain-containing protein [Burkholderia sp. BE17]